MKILKTIQRPFARTTRPLAVLSLVLTCTTQTLPALSSALADPPKNTNFNEPVKSIPQVPHSILRTTGGSILPLMLEVSARPELLQSDYLRRMLGGADDRGRYCLGQKVLHWSKVEQPGTSFSLQESNVFAATTVGAPPAACQHRELICHMRKSGFDLKQVRSFLGQPERRYFDNCAHPVEVYRFSPHASISLTEPANSFDVNQITVTYIGQTLPPPSAQSMALADGYRLAKAKRLLASGNTGLALTLLREHLADNPQDRGAHLVMAGILKRIGDVNGAMDEYRSALQLARACGDRDVEKRSLAGLSAFGVVVSPQASLPRNYGGEQFHARMQELEAISAAANVPKALPAANVRASNGDQLAGLNQPF
ncbi:MAG: hypothetical protein IPP97_12555 [Candidatus Obscuribacter sp.]|nr:hypothetical protein [Candidatus Obscuribacter sp.]